MISILPVWCDYLVRIPFGLQSVLAALSRIGAPVEVELGQVENRTETAIFDVGHAVLSVIFRPTQQHCHKHNKIFKKKSQINKSVISSIFCQFWSSELLFLGQNLSLADPQYSYNSQI